MRPAPRPQGTRTASSTGERRPQRSTARSPARPGRGSSRPRGASSAAGSQLLVFLRKYENALDSSESDEAHGDLRVSRRPPRAPERAIQRTNTADPHGGRDQCCDNRRVPLSLHARRHREQPSPTPDRRRSPRTSASRGRTPAPMPTASSPNMMRRRGPSPGRAICSSRTPVRGARAPSGCTKPARISTRKHARRRSRAAFV